MALFRRKFPRGVIVHSDRGSQYCSADYQALLNEHGLICSMSKRGDCYDNAVMESWNHSYKVETIHGERFATRWQAEKTTAEYIDFYYNVKRRHSTIGTECDPRRPMSWHMRHEPLFWVSMKLGEDQKSVTGIIHWENDEHEQD